MLDTVIVLRQDVFAPEERGLLAGLLNRLHVVTRPRVVRQEVLLQPGEPFDSARAAETERNLRALRLFRSVRVDTARVGGRLAAVVRTADAWSLLPQLEAQVAADGTLTGSVGATELNLAGTGNSLRAWYVRQVERDGLVLGLGVPRLGLGETAATATWQSLSDRSALGWSAGVPYRALSDRRSLIATGEAFDGRVLQYRVNGPADRDTVRWTRRATSARLTYSFAPRASPEGYFRVGISVEGRREEYFPREVHGALVPDTVHGQLGAFVQWRRAEFATFRYLNGFIEEDQDLSGTATLGLRFVPAGWGRDRTGVGVRLALGDGRRLATLLLRGQLEASGLVDAAGLDSGRVVAAGTGALRSGPRQATFLQAVGGIQRRPPPGGEFALGFGSLPRLWEPHAFVGTRTFRTTLEHRWYAADDLLGLVGFGLAGFLDYGGAWYPEQDVRTGGNLGVALLVGSPRSPYARVLQVAAGWRFGGGSGPGLEPGDASADEPGRWAITLMTGPTF